MVDEGEQLETIRVKDKDGNILTGSETEVEAVSEKLLKMGWRNVKVTMHLKIIG